jgi:hypothetical protein
VSLSSAILKVSNREGHGLEVKKNVIRGSRFTSVYNYYSPNTWM